MLSLQFAFAQKVEHTIGLLAPWPPDISEVTATSSASVTALPDRGHMSVLGTGGGGWSEECFTQRLAAEVSPTPLAERHAQWGGGDGALGG